MDNFFLKKLGEMGGCYFAKYMGESFQDFEADFP